MCFIRDIQAVPFLTGIGKVLDQAALIYLRSSMIFGWRKGCIAKPTACRYG
jgi:hypothetical protein